MTEEEKYLKAKAISNKIDELANRIGHAPSMDLMEEKLMHAYISQKGILITTMQELADMRTNILAIIEEIKVPESVSATINPETQKE